MPQNIFIGLGGTGQHILLAFNHLYNILSGDSFITYQKEIKLDNSAFQLYLNKSSVFLVDLHTDTDLIFELNRYGFTKEQNIFDPTPGDIEELTFKRFYGASFKSDNEKDLFNLLFSGISDVDVSKGAGCKPAVAASIAYMDALRGGKNLDKIYQTGEQKDRETDLKKFLDNLARNIENASNVILFGSIIGGTSAGLIPLLSKILKSRSEELLRQNKPAPRISGVLLGDFLPQKITDTRTEGDATPKNRTSNQNALKSYFSKDLDQHFHKLIEVKPDPSTDPGFEKSKVPFDPGRVGEIMLSPAHYLCAYEMMRLLKIKAGSISVDRENSEWEFITFGDDIVKEFKRDIEKPFIHFKASQNKLRKLIKLLKITYNPYLFHGIFPGIIAPMNFACAVAKMLGGIDNQSQFLEEIDSPEEPKSDRKVILWNTLMNEEYNQMYDKYLEMIIIGNPTDQKNIEHSIKTESKLSAFLNKERKCQGRPSNKKISGQQVIDFLDGEPVPDTHDSYEKSLAIAKYLLSQIYQSAITEI
jgi:hypothetical protein